VVVAYDDAAGSIAARLWWMLEASGHRAAVLDGWLAAWTGPLSTQIPNRAPADFTCPPWPADRLASTSEIERLQQEGAVLLDARAPERYRGEVEPIDPRPGHIPGAVNAPWATTVQPDGRLLEPAAARARYDELGAGPDASVVAYCGSGVTACHLLLTRAAAGLSPGQLYAGSWSAWCSDPARPVSQEGEGAPASGETSSPLTM
jgi:thiosulfate/3-mercaptopyruvate sulfurtransferase